MQALILQVLKVFFNYMIQVLEKGKESLFTSYSVNIYDGPLYFITNCKF